MTILPTDYPIEYNLYNYIRHIMTKRVFSVLLMVMAIIMGSASVHAQEMPQLTPLPEMPGLRTGKLPNGLTYYVLHNAKPEGRANFYIAQKVGSTLETQEQLGLAHFLEHMAFNGTKNYPGKNLLNYLQSKGLRFGADINAYTSFDETVYNIDNVQTSDEALMDSVLLALRDWSCDILLLDTEIEAERGVIQEEWRSRNSASDRMYKAMLPAIFEEYQYQQSPIGTMDVVMNFKPDVLRAYYHKWYRPDLQGIVVVGDFDAAKMEQKIIDMFSSIPMPPNAAERTYAEVSDNKEPLYFEFEDPELNRPMIMTAFKTDRVPFEYRNTFEMFVNNDLLQLVIQKLLNNRLEEYSNEPSCQYIAAGCYFGDFFVAKTKEAFFCNVIPKADAIAAYKDMMGVVARACKTGFTSSELERVNSEIIAELERAYNEREKTLTGERAEEIIRHFVENVAAPGAEMEYQIAMSILPQIPVEQVNMVASMLLTPENQVIVVQQPKKEGSVLPGKNAMVAALNEVMNATYEAYVDEAITEPFLKAEPVAGKIVGEKSGDFDTTEFTLSNGVKVILKSTDYAADQILVQAWREGGKLYYTDADAANIQLIGDAFEASCLGNYNVKMLKRFLSGKNVALGLTMGQRNFTYMGSSSVKDFPTLMEVFYAAMTDVNADEQQYDVMAKNAITHLKLAEANPEYIFQQQWYKSMYGGNAMMMPPTAADVEKADYAAMLGMIKNATANAADFTIAIVGNVDAATLRPLLEKYVASLPSTGKKTQLKEVNKIALPSGTVDNVFQLPMQVPVVKVLGIFSGEGLDNTMANQSQVGLLGDVLGNIYTNTLREEEGGTYSPSAFGQYLWNSRQWMLLYLFITNDEMSDRLQKRAYDEAMELLKNGTDADMFNKVRGAAINQHEIEMRNNGFWISNIQNKEMGLPLTVDEGEFLRGLTLEQFNAFVKGLKPADNYIKVVMDGVPVE